MAFPGGRNSLSTIFIRIIARDTVTVSLLRKSVVLIPPHTVMFSCKHCQEKS
jgi:hypothetical protein